VRGEDETRDSLPMFGHAERPLPPAGGLSTGPRTPEGLERMRRARTIHGFYTKEARAERAAARVAYRALRACFAAGVDTSLQRLRI
jgi:hypothetical protein